MTNNDPQATQITLDPAFVPIICASLLYAVSWLMGGCSHSGSPSQPAGGKKFSASRELVRLSQEDANDKLVPAVSGRKLTIDKMAQRAATSLQFSDEEYGIAFDAPKGYILREGDLPQMDRGLGYLGPIPMHFAESGGVRLATVEPPQGLHLGTNFVNEFFTVSAHYGVTPDSCAAFDIAPESRGGAVTRTVDSIPFRGFVEHSAASLHQYSGIYLHGFANETCYEIGYGVATVGDSVAQTPLPPPANFAGGILSAPSAASASSANALRKVAPENLLPKLEKILETVRIAPPDFERFTSAGER